MGIYQFSSKAPLLVRENVVPMTQTERRLAERLSLKIPLRVRIAKSVALDHRAESLNISTRGIYFATDLPLSKGTPVHLVFEMPEEVTHKPASQWRCTGHVVHVQPNSHPQGVTCAGVRFDCYEVLPVRPSVKPSLPIG
jgi:PilZ domain